MSDILDILGVRVSATNLDDASDSIDAWVKAKQKTYVCVAPVAVVMEAQDDKKFRDIINHADMVTPDGMPVVWSGRLAGKKNMARTYGPDLMLKLCEEGQTKGYRHFFYGSTQETNQRLVSNLKERFPSINIVGHYAPPFCEKDHIEDKNVLAIIDNASADILWVGLGAPKQEYWMHNHRDKLKLPVMIGVGAAFDFVAGVKKQAPVWMQKCGLEWFFRLCCEPKRLWKRYFIGNTRFLYLSFRDLLKRKPKEPKT